jgi:hypothetical protein
MSQVPAMLDRLERETGPDGNWTIHRNEHRTDYLSVGDWLDGSEFDWESPEEEARGIRENQIVVLHWYDKSPVGSFKLAAPDLESLARFFMEDSR